MFKSLQKNLKSFAVLPDSSGSFLQTYALHSSADTGSIPVKPAKPTHAKSILVDVFRTKCNSLRPLQTGYWLPFCGRQWDWVAAFCTDLLRVLNERKSEAISNLFHFRRRICYITKIGQLGVVNYRRFGPLYEKGLDFPSCNLSKLPLCSDF